MDDWLLQALRNWPGAILVGLLCFVFLVVSHHPSFVDGAAPLTSTTYIGFGVMATLVALGVVVSQSYWRRRGAVAPSPEPAQPSALPVPEAEDGATDTPVAGLNEPRAAFGAESDEPVETSSRRRPSSSTAREA